VTSPATGAADRPPLISPKTTVSKLLIV